MVEEDNSLDYYNESRYHMLNLHASFTKGTIEFRLFQFSDPHDGKRGGIHAGEMKAYIQLCLAMSELAKAESERRSRVNYTPRTESHSYSSSSSSGCFVITAANSSLNLLDRWGFKRLLSWKNTLKKESPLIAGLLEDYDRFAPVVVSKIDAEKNLKNLYGELWDKFISKVYELVCQKKYYDAARVYADMIKTLCSRYRLEIPEETRKELDCLLFTL